MKFVQYILKKIIPFFFISLFFISLILNLVDLFMNISSYLETKASVKDVLMVMIYYIPKTVWYASPIAFLFSVSYILSDLYASNEMVALFASGISLFKFVLPILIFAALGSLGMFFLEDKLVVKYLDKKQKLQNTLLGVEDNTDNDNVVVISDNSKVIYKAKHYNDETKGLYNVYFIFRDEEKNLEAIIFAKSAEWNIDKNRWIVSDAIQYEAIDDTLLVTDLSENYLSKLTENYDIFQNKIVDVESVNCKEAQQYITHLKKAGLPYFEEQSVYYKKFAFPFIFLISGLLAIGLTGKTRKNVLLISLALSIVSVVLFYVFQMCTMVLAKTEILTPLFGAWLPDFVFIFIAGFLLKFSKT